MYRSEEDKKIRKGQIVAAYQEIMNRQDLSEADKQFMLNSLADVVAADNADEMGQNK